MNDLLKLYHVQIVNTYHEFDEPQVTAFVCTGPESVNTLVAAYCTYYCGDPIIVSINGKIAETVLDHGLVDPLK